MTYVHRNIEYIMVLVIILTAGCASKHPYHTVDSTSDNCVDPAADQCTQSYYQEYPGYDLAFAEFTERGNAFNSNWIDSVLERIRERERENVLVIVGHSFGGAIVVSATTEVLAERAINRSENQDPGTSIGDAAIVLNPAIEANQSLSLVEAAIEKDYPDSQNPLFISISSDADAATHKIFPIGQTLGLLLTWHQLDLERPYYHDRSNNEHLVLSEEHLDATTVGNFAPFLTHRLVAESTGEIPNLNLQKCDDVPDQCAPKGLTTLSGHPTIGPLPDN